MAGISKTNAGGATTRPLLKQVAMVTGGSRGIGRAIAIRLAELGAAVAICGRDDEKLRESADALQALTEKALWQKADVTRADEVRKFVSETEAQLGAIGILVNNAGIGLFGPAHEKTEGEWDRVLNTNLKSTFLVSHAVVPLMIRRGAGDIINISSLAGRNTFAGGGAVLRFEVGIARAVGLHGGRPAGLWNPCECDLPWQRGDGILRAWGEGRG